jgi:hypothetical protein
MNLKLKNHERKYVVVMLDFFARVSSEVMKYGLGRHREEVFMARVQGPRGNPCTRDF